jgi:hypothetical protein
MDMHFDDGSLFLQGNPSAYCAPTPPPESRTSLRKDQRDGQSRDKYLPFLILFYLIPLIIIRWYHNPILVSFLQVKLRCRDSAKGEFSSWKRYFGFHYNMLSC